MQQRRALRNVAAACLIGAAAVSNGCMSPRYTHDQHGRVVGKYLEIDWGDTLSLVSFMASGMVAASADSVNEPGSKTMKALRQSQTLGSLARNLASFQTSDGGIECEPYGYRELESKVQEAIDNPEQFTQYLGIDLSSEIPEEARALEVFLGKWTGKARAIDTTAQMFDSQRTIRYERVDSAPGLVAVTSRGKLGAGWGKKDELSSSIIGWSPTERQYHSLTTTEVWDGRELERRSFGEAVLTYDPESNSWTKRSAIITSDNYFIQATEEVTINGDEMNVIGASNFDISKAKYRRVR